MSTILQRRRGIGNDGDNDDHGLEEGNWRTNTHGDDDDCKASPSSIEETSKQWRHRCQRAKMWKKISIVIVLVLFYLVFQKTLPNSPRLPVPNVDIEIPDADNWPLVHIVQSRFMQEQGPLEMLGMARLKLFLTFCLPSMVQQSSQNFVWIIKTDPQFTKTSVFDALIRSVRLHDNIYVVASNANFLFGSAGRKGSWRDGKEAMDLLESKIYTGNVTKLHIAMALRNERPVLETRLDADDGLHEHFMEYIQRMALKRFQPFKYDTNVNESNDAPIPRWLYWCSRRHIEWHSDTDPSLSQKQKAKMGSPELGYMNVVQHDKLCVTPGITIGYNINVDDKSKNIVDVPQFDHDKLYKNVRNSLACYNTDRKDSQDVEGNENVTNGPCLELVEDLIFCAIRSRTLTSAGMYNINLIANNVLRGDDTDKQKELIEKLWGFSKESFGMTIPNVKETQKFLVENKKRIAHENLLGQCSSGHSCKDTANEELRRIIIDLENGKGSR